MKYRSIFTGKTFTKEEWKKEYQALLRHSSGIIVSDEDAEEAFWREMHGGTIEEVEEDE